MSRNASIDPGLAPAVDGPGSSDAIADAKRKVLFSLPGLPRGPPRTQNGHKLRRQVRRGHKIGTNCALGGTDSYIFLTDFWTQFGE